MQESFEVLEVVWWAGGGAVPGAAEFRFQVARELLERGYRVRSMDGGQGDAPAVLGERVCLLVEGAAAEELAGLQQTAGATGWKVRDIHGMALDEVLALVESWRGERTLNRPAAAAPAGGGRSWKPWFPVIDFERCTNCMQCLSFCLFDVYGLDGAQRIEVRNPDRCKTNCPACARVCPEVAILFPKYGAGPVNGAPVSQRDAAREKVKVDISALMGGDIYAALRERNAAARSRFSLERSPDKALAERKQCLARLEREGIIPAEVLAGIDLDSLPGPEEIRRRAKEAAERAEAARKASQPKNRE